MNQTVTDLLTFEAFTKGAMFSLSRIRWFFYLISPYEAMYPALDMVPRYVVEVS